MKKLPVTLSKTEFQQGLGFLCFQQLFLPLLLGLLTAAISLTDAQLNFTYFLINYIIALILFRNFLWAELEIAVEQPGRVFSSMAIAYGIYYLMSTFLAYLTDWIDPAFSNLNDASIGAMSQQQFSLMTVGTVLLVPLSEELLFRGVLFNRIYQTKPLLACFVSVILFSLVHLVGFIMEYSPLHFFLAFLQYLPAGIALCYAYIRSGTIFSSVLFHTLVNALAMYYQFTLR